MNKDRTFGFVEAMRLCHAGVDVIRYSTSLSRDINLEFIQGCIIDHFTDKNYIISFEDVFAYDWRINFQ